MANIAYPNPTGYQDTPWTDQNGKLWIADSKGRWSAYVAPVSGGGASAWSDLTDKATAALPTDNEPLSSALALKAPLASPTFTGIFTVTATVNQNITLTTSGTGYTAITKGRVSSSMAFESASFLSLLSGSNFDASDGVVFSYAGTSASTHRTALGCDNAANLTGNLAVARIATALTTPGPIGGTTPAAITGTTGTFSSTVVIGGGTAITSSGATGAALVAAGTAAAALGNLGRKEIVLSATTSDVTSDTTYAHRSTFASFPVAANTSYRCEVCLFYTAGAGGLKARLTLPSMVGETTTAAQRMGVKIGTGDSFSTQVGGDSTANQAILITNSNAATNNQAFATLFFRTGVTAGNMVFEWAQNASNAAATKLLAGSFITLDAKATTP